MPYIDGNALALVLIGMLIGSIATMAILCLIQMWSKGEDSVEKKVEEASSSVERRNPRSP
jgi:hypothetical protein